MPKISVIIPCYNCEKYVAKCLDSVLAQTFQDWEAIVVNDGSTDGSVEILNRYAAKDSRIKVVTQENQGQAAARNRALKLVSGQYVCFLDSDDFYDAEFLMDLFTEAQYVNADIVMTNTKYVERKSVKQTHFGHKILTKFSDKVKVLPHGGVWDKIYKIDLIKNNQIIFPEGLYWEDNLFVINALFYSDKFSVIDGSGYNYVCNPNSTTRDPAKEIKRIQDSISIFRMIMDFARKKACLEEDKRALSDFCIINFLNIKKMDPKDFLKVKGLLQQTSLSDRLIRKRSRRIFKQTILNFLKKLFLLKNNSKLTYYIVSGGFDPIHEGHIEMIKAASSASDGVIVLVNSDEWLKRKKGKNFYSIQTRKSILENLKGVVDVIEFDDSDGSASDGIRKAKVKYPNIHLVFANGGDRGKDNIPEHPVCEECHVDLAFGVGGSSKMNSSSWILEQWGKA